VTSTDHSQLAAPVAAADPALADPDSQALPEVADAANVADSFIRLMRSFSRRKAQVMVEAQHSVEWSAIILISHLAVEGPMRSSALAEGVQSDPSTVSRQVAALVKEGLVERRADPADGRASVLAVTESGQQVYSEHKQARNEHYRQMLSGWSHDELQAFAGQLKRFADTFDRNRPQWLREAAAAGRLGSAQN
jgi:DNA-binding MarR family transcriptional regulator